MTEPAGTPAKAPAPSDAASAESTPAREEPAKSTNQLLQEFFGPKSPFLLAFEPQPLSLLPPDTKPETVKSVRAGMRFAALAKRAAERQAARELEAQDAETDKELSRLAAEVERLSSDKAAAEAEIAGMRAAAAVTEPPAAPGAVALSVTLSCAALSAAAAVAVYISQSQCTCTIQQCVHGIIFGA